MALRETVVAVLGPDLFECLLALPFGDQIKVPGMALIN